MSKAVRTTRRLWLTPRCIGLLACVTTSAITGCESLDESMGGLTSAFKQVTPSEAARWAVDPTDADKRREGIILLSNAPFGAVEVYVNLYRDSVANERDPIVKAAAIQALGKHGAPADALRIMPHLSATNDQLRWSAAKALQRLHNPAVVPELLRTLASENENRDVRIAVADALGQYPEDRVVQGLIGGLNARELAINTASERSLQTLTGMSFNLNAADWLAWYGEAIKTNSAFASQRDYLYPTYQRDILWYEHIVFWKPKVWEKPAPPAGLRDEDGHRTYEDSDAAATGPTMPNETQPATRKSTYGEGG